MRYKSIYPWDVIEQIKDGHKVHVLDKKTQSVYLVNELNVEIALKMTESKESGRFEFWYVEKDEVEDDGKL